MARPNWEYIRVDVLLPGHPKLAGLPRSARWTLVELWCFAGRYHTDGFINDDVWGETGPAADRRKLVERRLAERVDGGYQMHDYTGHNRSKEEIDALSTKRTEAGRKAAAVRWGSDSDTKSHSPRTDGAMRSASDPMPEAEAEAEAEADKDVPPASRVPPKGKHATRLPDDFKVTADMAAWARENVPHVDIPLEAMKFRDHWTAASGQKARKLDWTAAWRTWMRNADEWSSPRAASPPRATRSNPDDDYAAALKRIQARKEQANGHRGDGDNRPAGQVGLPAAAD